MKKTALASAFIVAILLVSVLAYALHGYFSARADASVLAARADRLIAEHRGAADLGPGRIDQLLAVEDPGFAHHSGIDLSTPGSGLTTLTQSLGKRIGFQRFRPGIRKVRLLGYARGLEAKLTKAQILALWLDNVQMGRGPTGWMTGFFAASQAIYDRPPTVLSQRQFSSLIAVPIAPGTFDLRAPSRQLTERIARIERLINKQCKPSGLRDVWLQGCARSQSSARDDFNAFRT